MPGRPGRVRCGFIHLVRSQVGGGSRLLTEAEPVLCALPVEIRDQLPATSRVMAALKTIRTLDTGALPRADSARIRWLQSTL